VAEVLEFDVVIVGSGFAGLAAGIEACRAGARVAIVEKRRHTGGNSRISDAVVAAADSLEQHAAGIDDSAQLLFEDMLAAGLGQNDRAWAREVAAESAAAFRWLVDELGCRFHPALHQFGGHSRARCLEAVGGGKALLKPLEAAFHDGGGVVLIGRAVQELVREPNGAIRGVVVDRATPGGSERQKLRAERGVVVAAGGYAGDVELRRRHDPRLDSQLGTTNLPNTTGEVLQLLADAGARLRDLEWIQLGPWTSPDERGYGLAPSFTSFSAFPYGIIVDADTGRRYVNELGDRRLQADQMLERQRPSLAIAGMNAVERSGQSIALARKSGCVEVFDSVESIAARHDVDPVELRQSISTFNGAIDRGFDDTLGKVILENCPPLRAPFAVARLWPKTHFTMGGVVVDLSTRVLDTDDAPIDGLWAAGEVTGGTHGACRLSSMAIPECVVQGRRAGRAAALSGPMRR
jgi:flavocytochrome c